MMVRHSMSRKVIAVDPQQTVGAARELLHRHQIRQLPVVRKQRLVGIITDRDLRSAGTASKRVGDVMTGKPIVIGPNASVDEAARLLRAHKIGALPVVEGVKVVGILTSSDILDAFVDLSGVAEATYRIVLSAAKGRQALRRVRQVVQDGHAELKWIHPDTRAADRLHLRLKTRSIDDIVTGLEAAGFAVDALVAPARARE